MNIILIAVALFASGISIILGIRYAWIFIETIINNKNTIKNKKYLILSFIHLFLIPLFIFLFITILSGFQGSIPIINLQESKSTNQKIISKNGYISYYNSEINIKTAKEIEIEVKNKEGITREFRIDISCPTSINCKEVFLIETERIILNPGLTIILPVKIENTQNLKESFEINISLIRKDNRLYDTIPLKIIID